MEPLEDLSENRLRLPKGQQVGLPVLHVKDLEKSLRFYEGTLGLKPIHRNKSPNDNLELIEFGLKERKSDSPLLVLKHDPYARETVHNFAGLFHFAILQPDRKSLGYALSNLQRKGVKFDGFADHLVSESLYLHDPEGNGIEIYRDKPMDEWSYDSKGLVVMDSLPLDLQSVLKDGEDLKEEHETFPKGTTIGHMHLRVTNLEQSVDFYAKNLGLHISADWSNFGAMFLAAGNYHHHLGLNTWHSLNGKKHEQDEAGLETFTFNTVDNNSKIKTKGSEDLLLTDPDGIAIILNHG
ncbi:MAG: VOC family protein [archaeon]|nr:VOC family protein [archaeon]